jgi:hypothetical protein
MDKAKQLTELDNEIEQNERTRARKNKDRWYVPHLGEVPQIQPEGIFHLLGGNLNSMTSKEVRDRKIFDIHRLIET